MTTYDTEDVVKTQFQENNEVSCGKMLMMNQHVMVALIMTFCMNIIKL